MSVNLTEKFTKFEADVNKYLEIKLKDMPVESVMEIAAFLGDKIRPLILDVMIDTQQECLRELKRASKPRYPFPPSNNDDVPSGVGGES